MKKQRSLIMFIALIIFTGAIALTFTTAHAAKRGTPGSSERKTYCNGRLTSCNQAVWDDCNERYTDVTLRLPCVTGGVKACRQSWGDLSDCTTREIFIPPSTSFPGTRPKGMAPEKPRNGQPAKPGVITTPKAKQQPVMPGVQTPSGAITKPKATRQPAKPGTMKSLRGESGQVCTDPAARSIDFRIVNKTNQFKGRVEITGTIKNIGLAAYETRTNQQSIELFEGSQLVKNQAFGNLSPGQTATIRYQRNWNSSSPAEGEFPPRYLLMIVYKPDITKDGNPKNDDCVGTNNRKERSGAAINGLFR